MTIKKQIIFLMLICLLLCICSCEIRSAKFDFEVKDGVIKLYDGHINYAELTVTTICISGRYYYVSRDTPNEGGRPIIVLLDGSELKAFGFDITGMENTTNVRRGDIIERTWDFDLPEGFEPGEYTVKVSWNKSEQTFYNVSFTRES